MSLLKLIRNTSYQLVASLIANLMLAVALAVVWQTQPTPTLNPKSANAKAEARSVKPKAAIVAAKPAAFHWRQLDAPDFPTYVRNLRSVGCPEATIRDIIQGELKEIYTPRRQEMESELATASPQSRAVLEQRLKQLQAEELAVLATTLSAEVGPPGAVADNQSNSPQALGAPGAGATTATNAAAHTSGSTMTPAAFLVGNDPSKPASSTELSVMPSDPRLNRPTAAVISQMRQDFANSVQNAGSDPSSPVYRQRWLSAQRASDERFSAMFGGDYFIQSQLQAVHAAADAAAAAQKTKP